jgi:hypothetical protein
MFPVQPPVPLPTNRRSSISFPIAPEQLYLNSILTALPLTYTHPEATSPALNPSTFSSKAWRDLAERVYADLAESPPSLINGLPRDIARAAATVMHGQPAPRFAHDL